MLALSFLTLTLMFPVLPMVTLKHTIFHSESCFRSVWRALRHGAPAIMGRHNADLKAAAFSQQGHFYTAWLQWVCVASGGEMDNLNRRSSPLLIPHAWTKNHRQRYWCFFLHEWHENGPLRLTMQAQAFCPKGTVTWWKKTVTTRCIC